MSSQLNGTDSLSDKDSTGNAESPKLTAIVLYTITIPLALVGNILVIYILYKRPETRRLTSFMYVNLAVADLLVTFVVMPHQLQTVLMDGKWLHGAFGEFLARFVVFAFFVAQMASVYSLTAIAFDSFFNIVFPMQEFLRFRNKNILVPCIWLISMCLMSLWLIIVEVTNDGQLSRIGFKYSQFGEIQSSIRGVKLFIVTTIFVLPLTTMSFLYGFICHKLRSHTVPGASLKHDKTRLHVNKTKRQVINMSIAIVVAFALCWLPVHVYHVIMAIDYEWSIEGHKSGYIMLVCFWCGHANSAVNPWMLIYFKKRFRAVFRKMITYPLSRTSLTSTRNSAGTVVLKRVSRNTVTSKDSCLYTSAL